MKKLKKPQCGRCESKECGEGKDCFSQKDNHKQIYEEDYIRKLHNTASTIEARYYGKETRLGEVILFAKELDCQKLGLAFCIGLSDEAKVLENILSKHFEVISVCCKVSGIDKSDFDLPQISPENRETMCNPAGQAQLLNDAKTELNVLCGLCVGHDAIFSKISDAPVTTLIAKDRLLAHNTAGAVYCPYVRKRFTENT